ncbi:ABC-type sugar transport system substrate-binding protein [Bradyrhizobium sp. LM2.7]
MNLKALFSAGATAALLFALPASAGQLTIGFSQIGSESGWRAAETSVSKQEAAKRQVNLKIADAQQKQENQIKAIRSFIAQNVDAIFLAPVVSTGWDSVLKEAKEAKIPVVLLDRDIDPSGKELYLTAVTSDSVHEGEVAGDWLAKTVGAKACNIVELQGTVGASVAANRKKGFDTAIAKHSNLKVVRSQTGDFTRAKGKEVMESFIKAEGGGKSICAVYAHNDDMMVGAIQAMKEAGLKPGNGDPHRLDRCGPGYLQGHGRRRSQRHRGTDPEHGGPGARCHRGLQGQGHGSAEVDPDRIQALYCGRRSAEDLRQQEGPRLLRRVPRRIAPCGPASLFETAVRTNWLGVRVTSGCRWE